MITYFETIRVVIFRTLLISPLKYQKWLYFSVNRITKGLIFSGSSSLLVPKLKPNIFYLKKLSLFTLWDNVIVSFRIPRTSLIVSLEHRSYLSRDRSVSRLSFCHFYCFLPACPSIFPTISWTVNLSAIFFSGSRIRIIVILFYQLLNFGPVSSFKWVTLPKWALLFNS